MRSCTECKGPMKEGKAKTPENVEYSFLRCTKCGEEIVDMKQLHEVAEKYRALKQYHAKLSRWGLSLGVRIPQELVRKYGFRDDQEVSIIPEKKGIRIIQS